jgi:hypothetical protein
MGIQQECGEGSKGFEEGALVDGWGMTRWVDFDGRGIEWEERVDV